MYATAAEASSTQASYSAEDMVMWTLPFTGVNVLFTVEDDPSLSEVMESVK